MTKPKVETRWAVETGRRTTYGKTKAEVLKRAADAIAKAEAEGTGWTLSHLFVTPRTAWPFVLVISRDCDALVNAWNKSHNGPCFHWTDSSGSRSVHWYGPRFTDDYDNATDLPVSVFDDLRRFLNDNGKEPGLMLRRQDPGLGIYIPEIDEPICSTGGVPDGCFPVAVT